MNHQIVKLNMEDGFTLTTQTWKPDGPVKGTIVVSHGLAEHTGRYAHVAEYFTGQGYAVYAADHRGHGVNRGTSFGYFERVAALADDLRRVVDLARSEQKTAPLSLLGHSFGGLLALYYTIKYQSTLQVLVVSAPLVTSSSEYPALQRYLVQFLSRVAPQLEVQALDSGTLSKDQTVVQSYDNDPNVYRGKVRARVATEIVDAGDFVRANLSKITLPILIMHGSADRLVKPEYSQVVYDGVSSTDKTLKYYEGLYHEIMNEPEKSRVLADIWVWLAAHQGTRPLKEG
jgi:alpha-beta hydrolase superfamily lysophospholipase